MASKRNVINSGLLSLPLATRKRMSRQFVSWAKTAQSDVIKKAALKRAEFILQ